jgi:hypothetical protein
MPPGHNAFPTGNGIDVPPGTYRVTVDYATAEGVSQSYQQQLSLP